MADAELEAQCQLLTDTLCPEAEDPVGCAAGFQNWWALIGMYMLSPWHPCEFSYFGVN